jgi:hypothetical protein
MKAEYLLLPLSAALTLLPGGCGEDDPFGPGDWNSAQSSGIVLEWKVEANDLVVRLTAPSTGWVGVGFDPESGMRNANFVIGYVSDSGAHIRDDFGTSQSSHMSDLSLGGYDDVTYEDGYEEGGETQIEFVIPLDSGDIYDKPLLEGVSYTVLLAYGEDGADDFESQHELTTSIEIEI